MNSNTHRVRRGLALATVVTALAVPAASASPSDPMGVDGYSVQRYTPTQSTDQPAAITPDGFDWADAGIGAAAVLALGAIGAGAAVATGHRPRHDHTVA